MSASSMPNRVVVRAHWWKSEGWKQAAKERKQGTFIIYRDKGDQWFCFIAFANPIVLYKMPPQRVPNPRNDTSSSQNLGDTLFVDFQGTWHEDVREEELPPPPPPPLGGDEGLRDILPAMFTQLVRKNE
ncbi:hypothetical protein MRB53_021594 [Persea americana]|uniref:Uncharacterized protein n=1 Tax=Persea americana TaxID=3435 RepID=A0ACC2L460_PERAE|nr:hypothetical protein MRB53_021594 [Persea americana]